MAGKLYGVGVGPGDPELITLKAIRIIKECDLIGIPAKSAAACTAYQIARQAVPQMEDKPVLAVPIPMTTDPDRRRAAYREGCERLLERLRAGKNIAFLNLGDPSIYGSCQELLEGVRTAGLEAEVISGVPSFCAVAAALGVPIALGQETIHILPGFYHGDEVEKYSGTRVLMKSAGRLEEVKQRLTSMEEAGQVKVYGVTDCGMESERICTDIRKLEEAGYFTTLVVKERKG